MTKLTTPSEAERKGKNFGPDFLDYLSDVIGIDPEEQKVEMFLDEEGNKKWKLNEKETKKLIQHLKQLEEELDKLENDPDYNPEKPYSLKYRKD